MLRVTTMLTFGVVVVLGDTERAGRGVLILRGLARTVHLTAVQG
jgi:hypothetical protein